MLTRVYVWLSSPRGVGHASISVDNSYISIWPKMTPAVGPMSVLPLSAELATDLAEDMTAEAHEHLPVINSTDTCAVTVHDGDNADQTPPDKVFDLTNLDVPAMKKYIEDERTKVREGYARYQLFPGVNVLQWMQNLVRDVGAYSNLDPVDISMQRQRIEEAAQDDSSASVTVDNCATLVGKILSVGGLPIKESCTPWRLNPDSLARQISDTLQQDGAVRSPSA